MTALAEVVALQLVPVNVKVDSLVLTAVKVRFPAPFIKYIIESKLSYLKVITYASSANMNSTSALHFLYTSFLLCSLCFPNFLVHGANNTNLGPGSYREIRNTE